MSHLELQNWYWLPDNEEHILPAFLIDVSSVGATFRLENGKEIRRSGDQLKGIQLLDSQCLDSSISNLIELHNLSENAVLHILRCRFQEDLIYTFVSSILVAVNPFRSLPIYDIETIDRYRNVQDKKNLPPHIFRTADEAYNALVRNYTSQSIVISGESGAGKTESIKLILKYIAHISRRGDNSNIEDHILKANPVMEAFGNAKTARNNNSSRFGKLITLRFSGGSIDEAGIVSYLLEKCRVVSHQPGERNYHIFYQLLAAIDEDPDFANCLGISNPRVDFHYVRRDEIGSVRGVNELEAFTEVQQAMEVLGIDNAQRYSISRVVAGVLLLGNIEFYPATTSGDAAAKISNLSDLEVICNLLGLNLREMQRCLTSRNFGVRSIVTCMFTVAQAADARDAFAKKLYAILFDWLIAVINDSLKSKSSKKSSVFIAVLDIFGFEAFEHNSFEQLLINYCNEKLQFHFNNHIFLMEQTEYAREGVDVDVITYIDNSMALDLLETRHTGILSMIDEEINMPKGTDETLLNKVFKTHGKHENLKKPSPKGDPQFRNKFIVSHYAGDVSYSVVGFLDKNKDAVSMDLVNIGLLSTDPFVQGLFAAEGGDMCVGSSRSRSASQGAQKKTLGGQFKAQLNSLIETLNQTEPHFVRCMKSNMQKLGNSFDSKVMLTQLRYSGLIEVCRIRQNGFPNRITHERFMKSYWMFCPSARTLAELVKAMEVEGYFTPDQYFIGTTKVFLKYETGLLLEQARNWAAGESATKFQRIIRGWLCRRRLQKIRKALKHLKRAIPTHDKFAIEDAVAMSNKFLPNRGLHIGIVMEARAMLNRMNEEEHAVAMLENAMQHMDLELLENAVRHARGMKPPLSSPLVRDCMNAVKQVKSNIHSMVSDYNRNNSSQPSSRGTSPPPPPPPRPPSQNTTATHLPQNSSHPSGSGVTSVPPPPLPSKHSPPPMPAGSNGPNSSESRSWGGSSQTNSHPDPPPQQPHVDHNVSQHQPSDTSQNTWNHLEAQPPSFVSVASRAKAFETKTVRPPHVETTRPDFSYHPPLFSPSADDAPPPPPPPPPRRGIARQESRSMSPPRSGRMIQPSTPRAYSPPPALETQDFFEQYNEPLPPPRQSGVRTSLLTRQLSKEEISTMSMLHSLIADLVDRSALETGITDDDILPLENMLRELSDCGSSTTQQMSDLMMAKEELSRAKKQLALQRTLQSVKPQTPQWKIRNLLNQATQLGMENYGGVLHIKKLLKEKERKEKRPSVNIR